MTGLEFYNYVLRKFKRTDKETEAYEAMTDTVALIRTKYDTEDYKEEAYSSGISSIGEYKLGLPTDFGHIIGNISVIDTNTDEEENVLRKISKDKYDEMYPERLLTDTDKMDTDTPLHYCIYAKQIFVGPVPDKTTYRYQFNYTTEPTSEIASDTDPVPFTDYTDRNVTRAGVLMELYDGMENYEESQYWKARFNEGLEDMFNKDERNIADSDQVMYHGV